MLSKLRKSCILPTNDSEEADGMGNDPYKSSHQMQNLIQHGVKTILDQGHLAPVPLSECPIYWQHDHVLQLYPPPDAVIIGDCSADNYVMKYGGCDAMNPGQFYSDFSFLAYKPFGTISRDGDVLSATEVIELG